MEWGGVGWGGREPFVFQRCLVEPCSRQDGSAMANMPSHTGDYSVTACGEQTALPLGRHCMSFSH